MGKGCMSMRRGKKFSVVLVWTMCLLMFASSLFGNAEPGERVSAQEEQGIISPDSGSRENESNSLKVDRDLEKSSEIETENQATGSDEVSKNKDEKLDDTRDENSESSEMEEEPESSTDLKNENDQIVLKVTVDLPEGILEEISPGEGWIKDADQNADIWTYTVKQDSIDPVTFTIGTPVWEGHVFEGWQVPNDQLEIISQDNDTYQLTLDSTSNQEITLTAQWKSECFINITDLSWAAKFNDNGNTSPKNTVIFSQIRKDNKPSIDELIQFLDEYENQILVTYTISDADGREMISRTKIPLSVKWKEENLDWTNFEKQLNGYVEKQLTTYVNVNEDYLKNLIIDYEKQNDLTWENTSVELTEGSSDKAKLTVQLGNDRTTDTGIRGDQNYLIDTVSPDNVTLNLFDYWLESKYLCDNHTDSPQSTLYTSGINNGHALLFRKSGASGKWNSWTGSSGGVTKNIVQNILDGNGFPKLDLKDKFNASGSYQSGGSVYTYNPEESLQYLFDPSLFTESSNYGEAHADVKGLFKINEDGNYYFSSHDNFAEFDEEKNQFNVYNTWGVNKGGTSPNGQFFPFNSADQIFEKSTDGSLKQKNVNSLDKVINHYLGMTMEVDFQQPLDGIVSVGDNGKPMTFDFSGDDDVWIFIDDVLVADLGGIHDEMSVSIDFSTGKVHIERAANPNANTTIDTTIKKQFENAGKTGIAFDGDTFAGNTTHTLKMFYLERGNTDSNLTLSFNLMEPVNNQIIKLDQNGQPVEGAEFTLYTAKVDESGSPILNDDGLSYEIESEKPIFSGLISDENGNITLPADYDYRQHTYYVLREKAPEGYFDPGDILLKYDKFQKHNDGTSSGTNLLMVENRWSTGAVASFGASVYQSGTLHYNDENQTVISQEKGQKGLILAVPLLKSTEGEWVPLYGSNLTGFETVEADSQRKAILEAALYQIYGSEIDQNNEYGYQKWYLEWNQENGRYQGKMSDLPGDADRYYWANPEYADMFMAYYFLDLESLTNVFGDITNETSEEKIAAIAEIISQGAANSTDREDIIKSVENIVSQVESNSSGVDKAFGLLDVSLFNRIFFSRIYIPNTEPELRVLKLDQDGEPIENVKFALYEEEDCSGTALSTGETNENGILLFSYKGVNGVHGISSMHFKGNTTYYLKEVQAPGNYEGNSSSIPVYVTEDGRIYADALESNDGITVRKGLGRLVETMAKYAGSGSINATLRDITGKLFTVETFEDITNKINANTGNEDGQELNFHYGLDNALLEYGTHEVDGVTPNSYFEVDENISGIIVHQNYDAHAGEALYSTVSQKTDLGKINIRGLFTGSTTVVVRNRIADSKGTFSIKKTVSGKGADKDKEFQFDVTVVQKDEDADITLDPKKEYNYIVKNSEGKELESGTITFDDNKAGEWKIGSAQKNNDVESEYIKQKDADSEYLIYLQDGQIVTVTGIPFGLEIKVRESDESAVGYRTLVSVNNGSWISSLESSGIVEKPVGNPFFVFNNHKDIVTDLTLKKTVSSGGEEDKEFPFEVMLYNSSGSALLTGKYDWKVVDETGNLITGDGHTGTIEDGTLNISLKHGEKLIISDIPIGSEYIIRESMLGYSPAVTVNEKKVTVEDGAISGTVEERLDSSSGNNQYLPTDVIYTNTRSGSITITKRTGTGELLSGAGFTLFEVTEDNKKEQIGSEQKTRLAMKSEVEENEFDKNSMRYTVGADSYVVHKIENGGKITYFYYRFLTSAEQNQYYQGTLPDADKVEAIVQFDELALDKTYAIEETTIPSGYVQNADIAKEMGKIKLPMEENDNPVYDILYTVTNHKEMVLPTSGLSGITVVLGAGVALLVIALILWRFRKISKDK